MSDAIGVNAMTGLDFQSAADQTIYALDGQPWLTLPGAGLGAAAVAALARRPRSRARV